LAAERRLASLQGESKRIPLCDIVIAEPIRTASMTPTQGPEEDESDGTDVEELRETDVDRRQTMMTSMDAIEADQLRTGTLTDFWGDFILPKRTTGEGRITGNKETGNDGSPRGTLQRVGNTSVAKSAASAAPVRTRTDPISTKFTPAQEFQNEKQDTLGHVVAEPRNPLDSTTSNSNQNLKVGSELRAIRKDKQIPMWSCLVCTL
jgi:DNA-dependent metalloprotease WSS1